MKLRPIANEIMREIPRANVFSLISPFAAGYGYWASQTFPKDAKQISNISLFAKDTQQNQIIESTLLKTAKGLPSPLLVRVSITPLPPKMRIEISCAVDWKRAYYHLGNTPCELAIGIIRYLLRKIEGEDRANTWQPLKDAIVSKQRMDADENNYDTRPEDGRQAEQLQSPPGAGDLPDAPETLTGPQVSALSELISDRFSKDELKDLALNLSMDYENLPQEKKLSMARELVLDVNRNNRVAKLWKLLYDMRPTVDWHQIVR